MPTANDVIRVGTLGRTTTGFLACFTAVVALISVSARGDDQRLPGTRPLKLDRPLDVFLLDGLHRHADRAIVVARERRHQELRRELADERTWQESVRGRRERFRQVIGAVDPRISRGDDSSAEFELVATLDRSSLRGTAGETTVHAVRWPVLDGLTAAGLLVRPSQVRAAVIAIPDATWSPEQFAGLIAGVPESAQFARPLAAAGCLVVIPLLVGRDDEWSGHPDVTFTNQSHREFVYRQAFEVGRHPIGYEVQKTLAAVDLCERWMRRQPPVEGAGKPVIGVAGIGQGGLTALYAAALDERIHATLVSGYFQRRDQVWREPLDRNVWRLLDEFGDAELAALVAPRRLLVEACAAPPVEGPRPARAGRRASAAPGRIGPIPLESVRDEFARAAASFQRGGAEHNLTLTISGVAGDGPVGGSDALAQFAAALGLPEPLPAQPPTWRLINEKAAAKRLEEDASQREKTQFVEMQTHVQTLLRRSDRTRAARWPSYERSDANAALEAWKKERTKFQAWVHDELIGRLTPSSSPADRTGTVHSRRTLEHARYTGYEVLIEFGDDVSAGGILLLPKDQREGEQRPVVVCQHGLEGTAHDVISREPQPFAYYKAFAEELCLRGFVVYAPQNPYRGEDRFRSLQRKANPLGRTLFSYIVAQHERTLDWLSSLPQVDGSRIAFYGLSYGGKTAMRVPPLLDRYCLAICSGDFTDWPRTIATNEERYGYAFTSEYEIPEWNLAHVASYAELAMLMAPRPFMVEQGHRDGGAPTEWVAGEYGKVRRHYDRLGIGPRTEIEFFDGPHTIHGQRTYRFLERFLK